MNIIVKTPRKKIKRIEVGIYVGNSSIRHGLIGFAIVMLQLDIAFDHLNCESVNIKVKQENTGAIKFNKRIGYDEKGKKLENITGTHESVYEENMMKIS